MIDLNEIKKKSVESAYNTWRDLGFLDGLDEDVARNTARHMTDMAIYLLENGDKYTQEHIPTIVFPMIRRACSKGGLKKIYTPERMCEIIEETFTPFTECIKTWGNNIDVEAEYCAFFADLFSNYQKV